MCYYFLSITLQFCLYYFLFLYSFFACLDAAFTLCSRLSNYLETKKCIISKLWMQWCGGKPSQKNSVHDQIQSWTPQGVWKSIRKIKKVVINFPDSEISPENYRYSIIILGNLEKYIFRILKCGLIVMCQLFLMSGKPILDFVALNTSNFSTLFIFKI